MSRSSVALFLCLVASVVSSWAGERAIPIEVSVSQSGSDPRLKVSVKNVSKESVSFYTSRLPWANRYSMIIVPVSLSTHNEVLAGVGIIDDPGPGTTVLGPGQLLSGEIDLAKRFSGKWSEFTTRPIVVFWSYQLETVDERRSKRVGGWLEIKGSL